MPSFKIPNKQGNSQVKNLVKKQKLFTSFDDLPVMLSVKDVCTVLGLSTAKTYKVVNTDGFPKLNVGKRLIVPKDRFIEWINSNTK